MKRLKNALLMPVILISFLLLTACPPSPGESAMFKFSKKEYDLSNVNLKFYFGLANPENRFREEYYYNIIILFSNSYSYTPNKQLDFNDPSIFFIKGIDPQDFFSKKYLYEQASGLSCSFLGKEEHYEHSEEIKVPSAAFNKTSGYIIFDVRVDEWELNGDSYKYRGNGAHHFVTRIYYKINKNNNNKVAISNLSFS